MHLIGDTVRMIVILGSGIFIVLFDKEKDSGTIDAYCAILVSIFTMIVTLPVIYGLVLTFAEFGKMPSDKRNAAVIEPEKLPIVSDGMSTPQGFERSSRGKWERDGL